jgi:hypothetical protein
MAKDLLDLAQKDVVSSPGKASECLADYSVF